MLLISGIILIGFIFFILYQLLRKNFIQNWKKIFAFTALSGAGAAFPAFFIIKFLGYNVLVIFHESVPAIEVSLIYLLTSVVITEAVKYAVFRIFIYNKEEFKDIVSAVAMAALFSGFVYIFQNFLFAVPLFGYLDGGYEILLLAAAVAGGAIFGYFLGEAKLKDGTGWELHLMGAGSSSAVNLFFLYLFSLKTAETALIMVLLLYVIAASSWFLLRRKSLI